MMPPSFAGLIPVRAAQLLWLVGSNVPIAVAKASQLALQDPPSNWPESARPATTSTTPVWTGCPSLLLPGRELYAHASGRTRRPAADWQNIRGIESPQGKARRREVLHFVAA